MGQKGERKNVSIEEWARKESNEGRAAKEMWRETRSAGCGGQGQCVEVSSREGERV